MLTAVLSVVFDCASAKRNSPPSLPAPVPILTLPPIVASPYVCNVEKYAVAEPVIPP